MLSYYMVTAMLTLVSLIILIFTFENRKINYYFMIQMLLIALANGGYLGIALASTVEEAVLANKIVYLGGCFVPPTTLFLICALANYKVAAWLRYALYSYSFFVYLLVLSIGYSDFYYKDVYLDKYDNATVLGHSYGIGHNFFYVILYGYIIIQVILLTYSLLKNRAVSRKSLWLLSFLLCVNIGLFIMGRQINSKIEIMPITYVVYSWIMLFLFRRGMMYSMEDNIANLYEKQESFGYIMFDKNLNYLGCNNVALKVFPKLADCMVDRQVAQMPELECILGWINSFDKGIKKKFSYEADNLHYECSIVNISHSNRICGYMVELRDDTDRWKYLSLLSDHNSALEKEVAKQTREIKEQAIRIKALFVQTVTALSDVVDAKDRYTSGHSKRVAEYSRMIAKRLGKSTEEQEEIYYAGLLHDVGKIRIPAEIINKPGKLTDEEYNIIKIHPVTGYHILRGISGGDRISISARYHHERYDGKGYPNGLYGDNIPEVARILGIADAYDAMTSNRSYRNALPQAAVRNEIEKGKGTQFDPHIADIMLQMIDEDKEYVMRQSDSMKRTILTVDDEAMNNKIIAHIMRDEEMYTVISAESGKEALEIMDKQPVDLILLDVHMPDMDGLETLKHIRKKYQTPVVLMTSDKKLDISVDFATLGCEDYITKPFSPFLMKEIVYNMVEKKLQNDFCDYKPQNY